MKIFTDVLNITKNSRGGGLVEAVVASGILGMIILGSMQFNSSISTVFANQILQQDQRMLENILEEQLGYPDFCRAIFNPVYSFNNLNNRSLILNNKGNGNVALRNLLPMKDLFVSYLETSRLGLVGDPFAARPDGTVLEFFTSTEVHLETEDNLKYKVVRIPLMFEVEKQGANRLLHGCYAQTSSLVNAQRSLCNQLGGLYSGQECRFPSFGSTRADYARMTTGPTTTTTTMLSDTLCEMDRRTTLIENITLPAIRSGARTLVPGIPGRGSTTKYCNIPQGSHPSSGLQYFR